MITENEMVEKVSELMDTAKVRAIKEARRIYRSGAFDPALFENNYILPKCFIRMAQENPCL
jgi:hypothetical protein